jgi:lysophospholipid acyltransferase
MQHLPILLQNLFAAIGDAVGLNASFAQFVTLLLLNVVLGFGFRFLRNPSLRMAASLTTGLCWTYVLYDAYNMAILLLISVAIYYLTVFVWVSPAKLTIFAVIVLSYFHISRMILDYMSWSVDITCPLMLMTAKFSMLAFDLSDGVKCKAKIALSPEAHVAEARAKTCVAEAPNLFEYLVYLFDFLGTIAGPVFHIREYLDFMYLRNDFKPDMVHMHSYRVALGRFLTGCVVGALFAGSSMVPQLNFDFILSEKFMSYSLGMRLVLLHLTTSALRLKYYFAWYMADAACLLAGIAYNPTCRDKYSRSQNAVILKVDFANCQAEAMTHWNMSISRWLRSCIYLRAIEAPMPKILNKKIGHRQYATILTRFVSAFWHGFYPGYYLGFFSTVLQSEADSIARKFIKPLFANADSTSPNWVYTIVGKIHTALCLNYYGAAFLVLSASSAIQVWTSVFFIGHAVNILTIVLVPMIARAFRITPRVKGDAIQKKTE